MKAIIHSFILMALLVLPFKGFSQLLIDPNFNIGQGFVGGGVGKVITQPDWKILVTGNFTTFDGTSRNRIARLNVDGTLDSFFDIGSGFNNPVYTMARQSDGKIIVGGHFTSYNGTLINRLIRLNIDGSLDNSFDVGTGFNSWVNTIALQSDGKILIGGNFQFFNGTPVNSIVRLNSDGSLDPSFNIGTGFNSWISSIVSQPDGKILVGGNFTSYNGTSINRLTRLNIDGSIDSSFNIGTGFTESNIWLYSIVLQSDGKILVGGSFTSFNGAPVNRIVRMNTDGSLDTSFNIGTGFNNYVNSIAIQSNGKIFIVGDFTSYNGTLVNRIVRLNSNGILDTSFDTGTGFNAWVHSIVFQSDGKALVGGNFTDYAGIACNGITRLITCVGVTGVDTQVTCGSYTWIDGLEYFESNSNATYTINNGAVSGCDSIIILNLTINNPITTTQNVIACESYIWNGNTYTTSGIYTANLTTVNGCDSTVTLNLTINQSNTIAEDVTACDFYDWQGNIYTSSGNYTFLLTNQQGCDSILTLNLTLENPPNSPTISVVSDTVLSVLPQNGVQYQWINCESTLPIENATEPTFMASINGNYSVVVSNACGADTSSCVFSTNFIHELSNNFFHVYPNPTSEKVHLKVLANLIGRTYQITDFTGKLIQADLIKETNHEINLIDVSTGLYFISIENQDKKIKINKQ